jgi:hypothetical protein
VIVISSNLKAGGDNINIARSHGERPVAVTLFALPNWRLSTFRAHVRVGTLGVTTSSNAVSAAPTF